MGASVGVGAAREHPGKGACRQVPGSLHSVVTICGETRDKNHRKPPPGTQPPARNLTNALASEDADGKSRVTAPPVRLGVRVKLPIDRPRAAHHACRANRMWEPNVMGRAAASACARPNDWFLMRIIMLCLVICPDKPQHQREETPTMKKPSA